MAQGSDLPGLASQLTADTFAHIGRESVHGMSYAEILDRANALTTPQERRRAKLNEYAAEHDL